VTIGETLIKAGETSDFEGRDGETAVRINICQGDEKRHERRQDKAKSDEKAEFMCNK
jgi:hypothetical protein